MTDATTGAGTGVWIQGAGELASGVAYRLFRSGYRVVAAETPRPATVRLQSSFSRAVFAGRCAVEGVAGLLVPAAGLRWRDDAVAVVVDPSAAAMPALRPAAVVDARMTKRSPEPLPAGDAPLIGLGPGFHAGRDAAAVIETHRGARLGAVIRSGPAAADTGVPGAVAGETSRRLLRAPAGGFLEPAARIGDLVRVGQILGTIGGEPLVSPLDGILRGLIHESVELYSGMKVGDVDPRGESVDPGLISDKALAVAGGVLEALLSLGVVPGTIDPKR